MTVRERIKAALENYSADTDNLDKLVALAYLIGREEATKEISDKYSNLLKEQKERAKECRYHNMAAYIVGEADYIYSPDYANETNCLFGSDETNL